MLVSVRSGARASVPGMMDTVLILGLHDCTVEALARSAGDERFVFEGRRLDHVSCSLFRVLIAWLAAAQAALEAASRESGEKRRTL